MPELCPQRWLAGRGRPLESLHHRIVGRTEPLIRLRTRMIRVLFVNRFGEIVFARLRIVHGDPRPFERAR